MSFCSLCTLSKIFLHTKEETNPYSLCREIYRGQSELTDFIVVLSEASKEVTVLGRPLWIIPKKNSKQTKMVYRTILWKKKATVVYEK